MRSASLPRRWSIINNPWRIVRELGDRALEAQSCRNIGLTYYDIGDHAKAEEYLAQAVQLAEQLGHPSLEKYREGLAQVRAARQG